MQIYQQQRQIKALEREKIEQMKEAQFAQQNKRGKSNVNIILNQTVVQKHKIKILDKSNKSEQKRMNIDKFKSATLPSNINIPNNLNMNGDNAQQFIVVKKSNKNDNKKQAEPTTKT